MLFCLFHLHYVNEVLMKKVTLIWVKMFALSVYFLTWNLCLILLIHGSAILCHVVWNGLITFRSELQNLLYHLLAEVQGELKWLSRSINKIKQLKVGWIVCVLYMQMYYKDWFWQIREDIHRCKYFFIFIFHWLLTEKQISVVRKRINIWKWFNCIWKIFSGLTLKYD